MNVLFLFVSVTLLLNNFVLADVENNCTISNFDEVASVLKNCQNVFIGNLTVPANKTLNLQPLDNTMITVIGKVTFEYAAWAGPLIQINGTGLVMQGIEGSVIDGNGPLYWDGLGEWGTLKPHFAFITAANSTFRNLTFISSPRYFILLSDSKNVTFTDMLLNNSNGDPEVVGVNRSGHNTDGIDVFNGTDITIKNSKIYNQDDCVAIRHGKNIHVTDLYCHGSHGVSISVGFSNTSFEQNTLTNVLIENCYLVNGENAIHIKNHVDTIVNGIISNVTYRNITFEAQTQFGIGIQQNYRNSPPGALQPNKPVGNILMTNFTFSNITGILNANEPGIIGVYINCANGTCQNWNWDHINVTKINNFCNFKPLGYTC